MKPRGALLVFGFFSLVVGCSSTGDDSQSRRADRVVLDVRCSADADCPTGFECEVENEHGTSTSYCKSHGSAGASSGSSGASSCPAGFEQEIEHGGTFCKPHGGQGGDGGSGAAGAACASNADCGAGLECETELEHGATTAFCKPHGGSGGNKGKN
jgi:hypothetical protein